MPHVAHPSADALLSACARSDWAQATRHWRALPPFARERIAIDALLCGCEALRAVDAGAERPAADAALRALCASAIDAAERVPFTAEVARALTADFCRLGLFQCFLAMSDHPGGRHTGSSYEECLSSWIQVHFRSDAKSFLVRLGAADARCALDALKSLASWAQEDDSPALGRAAVACARASTRFWPDERDHLAEQAQALLGAARERLSPTTTLPAHGLPEIRA